MRKIGITYALSAVTAAAITTAVQVQPALYFIDLTESGGKFPIIAVFLLTALTLLLPGVLIIFLISRFVRTEHVIPNLTDKTGVLLHRKRALSNGLYNLPVLLDGEKKGVLGNGQSIFLETLPGNHHIKLQGQKGAELEFDLAAGQVLKLETTFVEDGLKAKAVLTRQEEDNLV